MHWPMNISSLHFEDTVKDMFSEILLTRGNSGALLGLFGDLTPTAFPDASWSAERLALSEALHSPKI